MTTGSKSKNLREWMRSAARQLADVGIDEAMQEIRFLLDRGMGLDLTQQFLQAEKDLDPRWQQEADSLLARRLKREPLSSILGEQEFYGRPFKLNSFCLAPRPETELLVELGIDWLKRNGKGKSLAIAEFCCGSGAPGISLFLEAKKVPELELNTLYLSDIQEGALNAAKENAKLHGIEGFVESEICNLFPNNKWKFDLILVNPPYIAHGELATLMPEVREYEPKLALDGGVDGLDFYRRLSVGVGDYLLPGGCLIMEYAYDQKEAVRELFLPWIEKGASWKSVNDLSGWPRAALLEIN